MRKKLFVSMSVAALMAVPTALAATERESAHPAKLTAFKPFDKGDVTAFKKAQRERAARRLEKLYGSVQKPAALESIAACESGGDPTAVSSTGMYRGKYQFSYATWASVGGEGDPAAAPEAEQDYRAALLYNRSGPGQWPVCGA